MTATGGEKVEFGSWEEGRIEGTAPCTRYSQAVTLLEDTVYLFGGASSDDGQTTYHGDMFAISLSSSSLEWVTVRQEGAVPSAREGASFNVVGKKIYLHGGIENEKATACAEGLFVFTPESSTWEKMQVTGMAPTAQSSTTVAHENNLIAFGGIIGGKAQNCIHSLNLNTLEWSEIEATGTKPPPRCDHLATVLGGKMFVSAGSGSDDLWFNDIFLLDLSSWQWTQVNPVGGVAPSPRDYSTISTVTGRYLVQFGGFSGASGGEQCFADLHYALFDANNFQWRSAPVSSLLPARYAHSAIFYNNKLYVFGGQNLEEEFNDVWSISIQVPREVTFEPTPVPRVRYNTSTPIPAPRKVITPAPPANTKPRDLEELRTKYVKRLNEIFDTLIERFQQLDLATATLEAERNAFESEKKAHNELYEKQQQELDEMLKNHKQQNEDWIGRMRTELDEERRTLAEDKAAAEAASAELAQQQETFQQKSKKLDAIMRQVQGLKD